MKVFSHELGSGKREQNRALSNLMKKLKMSVPPLEIW